MRSQAFFVVGALCGLLSVVTAVPALQFSGVVESCGITTVYITVAPPSATTTLVQLLNTPPVDYGGVAKSASASVATSGTSEYSILGSSSGIDSTSTAHLTSTVHQTVFLTSTMIGSGTTRTETTEITYSTSLSLPTGYVVQTYATLVESMSSADVVVASSSSLTASQAINTASGNYIYPAITMKTQPSCSGDLVTCPETAALNSMSSSSTEDIISSQVIGSTSTLPVVYVIETLTVIPLATLPAVSRSSGDLPTTLTVLSTMVSTMIAMPTEVASLAPTMTNMASASGLPGTASTSSSSGSYSSLGAGGWNMSISSSLVSMNGSNWASTRTGVATSTLAVDALSSATSTSTASSYSSASINFSNSYIFLNVTSALAAQSGFAALPASPISSSSTEGLAYSEILSLTSTSPTLSQTTQTASTELGSEIGLSTTSIEALQSTAMPPNVTASFFLSSLTTSGPARTASESAWTESCTEEDSTMNAGQSAFTSLSGVSRSAFLPTPYASAVSFLNSTTLSSYSAMTTFSTSASNKSTATSAQSTSSSLSTSNLSYPSSEPTASSFSQISSSISSEAMSTTYVTTTTTSTSTPYLLTAPTSSASSNITSETKPPASTSSELSISSPVYFPSSESPTSTSSLVSPATSYEPASIIISASTTPVALSSLSSTSVPEDTCTGSVVPTSSTLASSTSTSSVLTFTTLTTSNSSTPASSMTALSAITGSSTSSSSPAPTLCGQHGPFTLSFDDLPQLSVKNGTTADPMPLFSPYHQFYFSSGWTIVPPPTDPYKPSSPPLLVEFLANPNSALGYTGALGNGENALLGCFNFNAIGMSLGCDSEGPDCDWQFTGLRYNNVTKATDTITTQTTSTAACPGMANCNLVPVVLDATFTNLTELRINVTVAGAEKIWWLDDLLLAWFDDSCDAGLCRVKHI